MRCGYDVIASATQACLASDEVDLIQRNPSVPPSNHPGPNVLTLGATMDGIDASPDEPGNFVAPLVHVYRRYHVSLLDILNIPRSEFCKP